MARKHFYILVVVAFLLGYASDYIATADKWKPNINNARIIIATEARDVDSKPAWHVEMRYGSNWPDHYVAKNNELGGLCSKFTGGK